jgi:hypothetical protein
LPAVVEMGMLMLAEVVPGLLLAALTNEIAAGAGPETTADAMSAAAAARGVRFMVPPVLGIRRSASDVRHPTFGAEASIGKETGAATGGS